MFSPTWPHPSRLFVFRDILTPRWLPLILNTSSWNVRQQSYSSLQVGAQPHTEKSNTNWNICMKRNLLMEAKLQVKCRFNLARTLFLINQSLEFFCNGEAVQTRWVFINPVQSVRSHISAHSEPASPVLTQHSVPNRYKLGCQNIRKQLSVFCNTIHQQNTVFAVRGVVSLLFGQ